MQSTIHHSKSDVAFNVTASPIRPIVSGRENHDPLTPMSTKRKQVLINEKNTSILQLWDQKLRLSNNRMEAFTLNEMANVERLRNVQEKITEVTDLLANEFKEKVQTILSNNQLLITQIPQNLTPSTLFKDGQQMTSEAFFDEMNKRYFVDDKSFEKYSETMELFRSSYLILKRNNDILRNQLKDSSIDTEFVQIQEKFENLLAERDSYLALYTMAKIRAEKAEEKLEKYEKQQKSFVELLVEKFGFVDRFVDRHTIIARDLFKPDTNIEIFSNFKVQLSTGEQGFIDTSKSCPPGKFKISIPNGLSSDTIDFISRTDDESTEPIKIILKFRKFLFQSDFNGEE